MSAMVLHNQSLLDICVQHTGAYSGLLDLAIQNGLSITSDLVAGENLEVTGIEGDDDVLRYYTNRGIKPATAIQTTTTTTLEGISIWAIKTEFEVQ